MYYRSYFALPESMTAPDGRPHNAIRGFLTTLTRLVERFPGHDLACAWDDDWRPAWRTELLPSYKAHRVAAAPADAVDAGGDVDAEMEPETLGPQAEAIALLLDAMGIPRPGAPGYEADDALGTLVAQLPGPKVVVTGDRDLVQLVSRDGRVLLAVNGGMEKWPLLDSELARERFGVDADRYVDLAVLRGDPSDGLPGIRGIGAKTAVQLVNSWSDLDSLIADARTVLEPSGAGAHGQLTKRRAESIVEGEAYLRAARTVATVVRDAPLERVRGVTHHGNVTRISRGSGVERQALALQPALAGSR